MNLKNIAIAFFVLATFTYTGCNKIKEALDVTFNTSFSTNINFDVPAASRDINEGGTFNQTATIDMTTVTQFNDYKDKLKSATVKSITFTVTSISEEPVTLTDVEISIYYGDLAMPVYTITSMEITNGSSFTLPEAQFDVVNQIILNAVGITVGVSGNSSVAPVQFTYKTEIDAEIVANPL